MDTIYLDNNATTRPAPEVVEAMHVALREQWANPSSVHRLGQRVRQAMELARESVALLIGAQPRECIFTSGGTEAANLALQGSLLRQHPHARHAVITTRVEHSAVREMAETLGTRGAEIIWLANDRNGLVDLDQIATLLRTRGDTIAIVSVMWVNNETGVIQPIEAIGQLCREAGVLFHVDATQMVGKLPLQISALPIDLMSFAAHKFHGPKGVGVLYARRGVKVEPIIVGGPQEQQRRGGTENVAGIIGMGVAADLARIWLEAQSLESLHEMRDQFEADLQQRTGTAIINAGDAKRIWSTSNISFPGMEAEAMLLMLSERGVCASAGAACSSGSLDPSAVLAAMEIATEHAVGSIRFSTSRETTQTELHAAVEIIADVHDRLRELTEA